MKKDSTKQKQIGDFIKMLRIQKGLTQSEFAKLLKTSQSAANGTNGTFDIVAALYRSFRLVATQRKAFFRQNAPKKSHFAPLYTLHASRSSLQRRR